MGTPMVKFMRGISVDPSTAPPRQRGYATMDTHRSPLRWHALSAAAVGIALLVNLILAGWIRPVIFWPYFLAILAG